jgi:hypothetical protein
MGGRELDYRVKAQAIAQEALGADRYQQAVAAGETMNTETAFTESRTILDGLIAGAT